jgi:hypothetical protein
MANVRVDVESVRVIEGQGIGEGDPEIRIEVKEGSNRVIWPSLNGWVKVDKGGAAQTIGDGKVAIYSVSSGTLSKTFTIDVTEIDGGTLGQDDQGHGTLTFDLTPTMGVSRKSAVIKLKRPKMKYLGKVEVTMTAQRI